MSRFKLVADYINVLQAQRSLYAAEDAFVQTTGTISMHLVTLYKALGGGWDYLVTTTALKTEEQKPKKINNHAYKTWFVFDL